MGDRKFLHKMDPFKWLSVFCLLATLLSGTHFPNSQSASVPTYENETDLLALLDFKARITDDPLGVLSSWNRSFHFCSWRGVRCGDPPGRVTALNLWSQSLAGTLTPHIGNLTFLRVFNLPNNTFNGEIPREIGRLFQLQYLNLSKNLLHGQVPDNITYCSELRYLDLSLNYLVWRIPAKLGVLSKLVALGLANNYLSGSIPTSISNLSSLEQLSLSDNSLSGNIPEDLGQLSKLKVFQVSSNKLLTGTIPHQLFNVSSIMFFGVAENQLSGSIPSYIGLTLPNIKRLLLGKNSFYGRIPESLSNASLLQSLDFPLNRFSGPIPMNLGKLQDLTKLNVGLNRLGSGEADDLSFLTSLANCSQLQVLTINNNRFGGQLPSSIANLSAKLQYLYMGANRISGNIPMGVENLGDLTILAMEENFLEGSIPDSIGKLTNLQSLALFGNKFSGEIPSSIGNISFLSELILDGNNLHGNIPSSLGNCQMLNTLSLAHNKLEGIIPKPIMGLSSLSTWLDLSQNSLTGILPVEVEKLKNIRYFSLSENELSGEIPSALENCLTMEGLYLAGNFFEGTIPSSLRNLRGLQDLDLSRNNLTGQIPNYLEILPYMKSLNLSSNDLEGEVPKTGIFKNTSAFSVIGNKKLCGGIPQLHLPVCSTRPSKKKQRRALLKKAMFVVGGIICLALLCLLVYLFRRRMTSIEPSSNTSLEDVFLKVSYDHLLKGTDGFASANLIGTGSYGRVYKAVLKGRTVAVKVLDLNRRGASKSFMAECEVLRNVRHRNLVKILTSCSSIDFKGEEFKALVFEFMPNGNLDTWLHPRGGELHRSRYLSFMERLNIAIDVANGVDYIHHHGHVPIVHCDLKPSNILLDEDLNGHVGDFGISRFLSGTIGGSENQTSSIGIKGSVGYVAPEYGVHADVWTNGDVYSYGILLLEMFIGRRPTDDMFKDGLSLHSLARTALPDGVIKITDSTLVQEIEEESQEMFDDLRANFKCKMVESLIKIIRVGVSCSNELPKERMEMGHTVTELQNIKDAFFGICGTRSRDFTTSII